MRTGTFTDWLKKHYPHAAFRKDGRISKQFVRSHYKAWSPRIRSKAQFFINTVKG